MFNSTGAISVDFTRIYKYNLVETRIEPTILAKYKQVDVIRMMRIYNKEYLRTYLNA